jgi:hypothetical protein
MKDKPFWQSFELLASSLSGSREESEATLDSPPMMGPTVTSCGAATARPPAHSLSPT